MKELIINKNDSGQRLDRFLKKYLSKAPKSFIYKMIRKKNIKLNNKKASPDATVLEGDTIQLYLADETIEKFKDQTIIEKSHLSINIIYEDTNIILINKPVGVLSHSANKDYGNNVVDSMVHYLYQKGEYDPKIEKTFIPAICNRLDRNTSGIIIGAKNYPALKSVNDAIRKRNIKRYYKTIVEGVIKKDRFLEGFLSKDVELNKAEITEKEREDSKKIITGIRVLATSEQYSLLEIELITGRTHQIRAHLASIGHPIIGDMKYGNRKTNKYFKERYDLQSQFLHGYRIIFTELDKSIDYLEGKEFIAKGGQTFIRIEKELFQ